MFRRLQGIFRRHAASHVALTGRPRRLFDADGGQIGALQRIELRQGRLEVAGWVRRSGITLRIGAAESSSRHSAPMMGFQIALPCTSDRLDPGHGATLQPDGAPATALLLPRQSRAINLLRFAAALLRATPALAGWVWRRSPQARARITRILAPGAAHPVGLIDAKPLAAPAAARLAPIGTAPPLITIILPLRDGFDRLDAVLGRLRRHTDLPWQMILIDDASDDPRVRPLLRRWTKTSNAENHPSQPAAGTVRLIENAAPLGPVACINAALGLTLTDVAAGPVIVLDAAVCLPQGWASRLIRPMLQDAGVASITPLANDAGIFSVPAIGAGFGLRPGQIDDLDAVAHRLFARADPVRVPGGLRFCMALNRRFLHRFPGFDPAFGNDYGDDGGAETDWCCKVQALGGRHLALPGLFVYRQTATPAARPRGPAPLNGLIAQRYPGHERARRDFIAGDPLLCTRLALALAWAGGGEAENLAAEPVALYLAHSLGGGGENHLAATIAGRTDNGQPSVVLRVGGDSRWQLELYAPFGSIAARTGDFALVTRLLEPLQRRHIIYSCGVGDPDPITLPGHLLALKRTAADRVDILFHDYLPISPSHNLLNGNGVFAGPVIAGPAVAGPAVAGHDPADRAHCARRPDGRRASLAEWQAAWGALLAVADTVRVFSHSSRALVLAVWPDLHQRLQVVPHRLLSPVPRLPPPPATGRRVVGVLGDIGYPKGAALLRDLALRLGESGTAAGDAKIGLVVIGRMDPAYALPDRITVHGAYRIAEIPALVQRYGIGQWLIPSICPETFSYTTHEALATGLPVMSFAIGAQGEAVAAQANGILMRYAAPGAASGAASGATPEISPETAPTMADLSRVVLETLLRHIAAPHSQPRPARTGPVLEPD